MLKPGVESAESKVKSGRATMLDGSGENTLEAI
jgi:hypothetical protein